MSRDEHYMLRALELAEKGRGQASPNPMVGCVIVWEDKIIGEGYHEFYGGPHAEPNALMQIKDPGLLRRATVYVTLEPCAHFGKTPPCADLLIQKQIKKVVIATRDENPLVGGKGIEKLQKAGIEVVSGVLEKEARILNKRFFTFLEKKRPYILLKWAETKDGFMARSNYDSKWISNAYSRQLVHKWRTEEDAILVGTNTARYDDPKLNARDWEGKNPLRLVIDTHLRLTNNLALFDGTQPTVCYNILKEEEKENLHFVKMPAGFNLDDIMKDLYQRKVQSLIVEGGAYLINKFLEAELWDEARVFVGNQLFGEGIPAPNMQRRLSEVIELMDDKLYIYYPNK